MSSSKFRIRNQQTLGTEEEWYIQATRTLRLQIEDQLRPIVPGIYPPWHADLEIQCHVRGVHFLRNYLVVSAPRTTELKLLVDVLAETSHHGIPSQLTVSDFNCSITFESGGGMREDSLQEALKLSLGRFIDFIEAVYELEASGWREAILFRKLIRETNQALTL
jgi:hypothetical protein